MRSVLLMSMLLAAPACTGGAYHARPVATAFLPAGTASDAPTGFAAMCKRADGGCNEEAVAAVAEPVGSQRIALIQRINRRVNGGVRQRTDQQIFGQGDYWQATGTGSNAQGDCEDLALEKQRRLLAAGMPRDDLRLGIVYRRDIGLHAVLIARTDHGDMVLDSRTPYVNRWDDVPYSWVSQQRRSGSLQWSQVAPAPRGQAEVAALSGRVAGRLAQASSRH